MSPWIDRHPWRCLALIVLLCALINAVVVGRDWRPIGSGETVHWWPPALNLAHGAGYTDCRPKYFPFCGPDNRTTAMREPIPVLVFAATAALSGDSLPTAVALQFAFNLMVVPAVFLLTRRLAGSRAALLAALLWSLYLPPGQLFIPEVCGDLLATLAIAWGMFLFFRAQDLNRPRDWLAAGAVLGAAALSRSALIVLAPVLALGTMAWPPRNDAPNGAGRWAGLRPAAVFILAFGLVIAPWLARNYAAFGHPVLGTTLTGYNLYRENSQLRTDDYLRFVSSVEGVSAVVTVLERRPDLQGTENEAQMDAVYREEAMRIIAAHPFRYAALFAYRFAMLWFDWGVKAAYGYHDERWWDYAMMVQHAGLLAAAILGGALLLRRGWPLALALIATSLAYMAVIGRLRLIVPVMPLAVAFSAAACERLAYQFGLVRAPAPCESDRPRPTDNEWWRTARNEERV